MEDGVGVLGGGMKERRGNYDWYVKWKRTIKLYETTSTTTKKTLDLTALKGAWSTWASGYQRCSEIRPVCMANFLILGILNLDLQLSLFLCCPVCGRMNASHSSGLLPSVSSTGPQIQPLNDIASHLPPAVATESFSTNWQTSLCDKMRPR